MSLIGAAATDSNWPQWRGPKRTGEFAGPGWPDTLDDAHLKRMWRVERGPSYSGPVVDAERVYTTETRDKKTEVVTAFDRKTGRELWKAEWEGAISVPFFAKSNGDWIRSTPALDGDRLYIAGMRDVLVCLETASGNEKWRVDFVKSLGTPLPDFGCVCSPLVQGDAVYVQAGASMVKLDKLTGKILWRTLQDQGGTMGSAFSSPFLADFGGKTQLIVQTRLKLAGLDPENGSVLWEQAVEAFRGMNILTPVVLNDMLLTSTYGGKTIGYRAAQSDGRWTVTEVWKNKSQGYMTTPVLVDGVAYEHLKSQRVMAIEVASGKELWTSDQSFGKYWSLVSQGDRMLALDQTGILYLIRANREKLEILDHRKIAESETWAHIAPAGDQIFIRELDGLSAFRWTAAAQ